MKAGFFVMKWKCHVLVSPEYEMMEEFFQRTEIPFEDKQWNENFWEFQTQKEAIQHSIAIRKGIGHRLISLFEHCKKESGLINPREIRQYMDRHYSLN